MKLTKQKVCLIVLISSVFLLASAVAINLLATIESLKTIADSDEFKTAFDTEAQSGEKFICPSGITFNQKPVFCPANHKIDKDPALRGQQGTSACLVLGQRLDICRYQRLQEICGLCAGDAKYLSRIVTRKATGQRCRIIAHGSVISPS